MFETTAPQSGTPSRHRQVAPLESVIKRDGRTVPYDRTRIVHAIEMAFRAQLGVPYPDALAVAVVERVERIAWQVEQGLAAAEEQGTGAPAGVAGIETIQDEVERQLMAAGEYAVGRRYILYREARAQRRQGQQLRIREVTGGESILSAAVLRSAIAGAARGLGDAVDVERVYRETLASVYDGITRTELSRAAIFAARSHIEEQPEYTYLAARLLLDQLYSEVLERPAAGGEVEELYPERFFSYLQTGVACGRLDARLLEFDAARLAPAIRAERDRAFAFMGVQTLYDRYLLHDRGRRFELPQWFWMRVAMGLALTEAVRERETRAIEFYDLLSTFAFCSSTPTLFNAGTVHPQLSSCFLTTVPDDLGGIFKAIRDDALLSKWSGGLGNDWTPVRALGSHIRGTNGTSQGVIPFLKVANDTAVAVNQGGKRQGAICAYLETWHLDIEEFLALRKNTGDDRRRTHDMHTANWIPDLFMKRVREDGTWTLFSPDDVPDLHDLYGRAFEQRYIEYEQRARDAASGPCPAGTCITKFKRVRAVDLWRKMLAMLFETGHPWLTFKDAANVRSPQDHCGVVHSSNLCTEILLNTSADEAAVCNLGSINLVAHVSERGLDVDKLARTVRTALRMLDNVIDINLYPIPEARAANLRHRPVGLGLMGFQDALYRMGIGFASDEAMDFADRSMEAISYYAILASSELAAERGAYDSFAGSKWSRGLLPIDTLDLLEAERGVSVPVNRETTMDWDVVRASVRTHGMRNSNVLAIAPTATIANIADVSQSIEPTYKNLFAKSNLSGEFTVVNRYLVEDLRQLGLWDAELVEDLKHYDGSVQEIARIPDEVRARYLTAFEIEPEWLIEAAARRQKWIDMGQSLNLYLDVPSGTRLGEMYQLAWEKGLKTTYYLRAIGAGGVEKSTLDINRRGIQPRWMKSKSASSGVHVTRSPGDVPDATAANARTTPPPGALPGAHCNLDGDCESCQ